MEDLNETLSKLLYRPPEIIMGELWQIVDQLRGRIPQLITALDSEYKVFGVRSAAVQDGSLAFAVLLSLMLSSVSFSSDPQTRKQQIGNVYEVGDRAGVTSKDLRLLLEHEKTIRSSLGIGCYTNCS